MDRRQLTNTLAVVVMLAVISAVGLRLWASSARSHMPQLAMVHPGPDGGLYTMLADTLYVDDADGDSKAVIPLSRLGISGFWGDFAVLSDGSVILPASKQPSDSLGKEARIALRAPAAGSSRTGAVPLTRCAVEALSCQPLTGSPAADYFQADRTFKLAVDETAGRIYVADTAAQRLLILDMQGRILAKQTEGMLFPNQLILLQPGLLEVANTNRFELQRFDVSADSFVAKGDPESTVGWNRGLLHDFPVGLAHDQHGGQWVLLTDGAIEHGMLYRRASDDAAPRQLPLPEDADVLFLAAAGYHVLAVDQAGYAIHSFSLEGESLPDAGSDKLQAALAGFSSSRRLYDALFSYSFIALFVVLALALLAFMLLRQQGPVAEAEPAAFGGNVGAQPAGFTPAPAMAGTGREFEFRRSYGIMNRRGRWLSFGIAVLLGVLVVVTLSLPPQARAHTPYQADGRGYFDVGLTLVVSIVLAVAYLLSRRYERLYVSHSGIRYSTWLSGPAAFLASLYPSWELRWDELTDIRLVKRLYGRSGVAWYYVFTPKAGKERRVNAYWTQVGAAPEDLGLSLWQLFKSDIAAYKQAIARSQLFRLLDLTMRARQGQFSHSLIESADA